MKKNPIFISFLQALGLSSYISLVAVIFWKGDEWFGQANNYLGPALVLTLLVASALTCGAIALGYPLYIALDKKKTQEAIKIVVYTTLWVIIFFAIVAIARFI
jgi:hypothetical protein